MKIAKMKSLILVFVALAVAVPMAANADRHEGRHDGAHWRAGHWRHGAHDGRLGWWWVAGGLWYFYPRPVYPYPDAYAPPVAVIPQTPPPVPDASAPQAQNWYYCASAKAYYPYVSSCPEGWKMVPATPPGVPAQ